MMGDFFARALAIAFALLAAGAAGGLLTHWGEPLLRSVARGLFVGALLEMSLMAWRWPRRRPRRFRERAGRLLEVIATPRRHAEYAESTPQVGLPVALLDDWALLSEERLLLPAGALSAEETSALAGLTQVIDHLRPSLIALGTTPVPELDQHEPWRLLVKAAERARSEWISAPPA